MRNRYSIGDEVDVNAALKLCRVVRKELHEMLADLQARDFFDVASDVGEMAKGGWAFDKMDEELKTLEGHLEKDDLAAIGKSQWSIYELANFYDALSRTMHKHPSTTDREKLVNDVERWKFNAGQFAQMVCQLEDSD